MSNAATTKHSTTRDRNAFPVLPDADAHSRYFNLLARTFGMYMEGYRQLLQRKGQSATFEEAQVRKLLHRLQHSVEALRMKYTHRPDYHAPLWVDPKASGFPHFQEFSGLVTDLVAKQNDLREIRPVEILKEHALDVLLRDHAEPAELLWQIAERYYLEMLVEDQLFLPVTIGELVRKPVERSDRRGYAFAWGCFDFESNLPYLHILDFEQDAERPELENEEGNHAQFMQVIRTEGARAPRLGILAFALDEALPYIHPKVLKRISLGPLYAPLLAEGREKEEFIPAEIEHFKLLERYGEADDFMLWFDVEVVYSDRENAERGFIGNVKRTREIFAIPSTDTEAYERKVSFYTRYVLLPHRVLQHVGPAVRKRFPELQNARTITYNTEGDIHAL